MKSIIHKYKLENINKSSLLNINEYKDGLLVPEIKEGYKTLHTDISKSDHIEILLDGIIINIRYDNILEPVNIKIEHNTPCIRVDFEIEGHSVYQPENKENSKITIKNNHYNFFYLPEVKGVVTYNTKTRKSLNIMVTEKYLKKAFNNNINNIAPEFQQCLKHNSEYLMFKESKKTPSVLLLIINDIISCSYQKEVKQVYLESKVKEVFSYLFSEISKKEEDQESIYELNESEHSQILKAEKILQQNIHIPLTIEKLALLSGINQQKLKKNFKIVFKEPIFTYLTNVRMEKAKALIIEKTMGITEVAYLVGYKNPQHFTVAFKKKFNYLPSDLRKRIQ